MRYNYQARDSQNNLVGGGIDAESEEIAGATLRDLGYTVMSLEAQRRDLLNLSLPFLTPVSTKDIVIFTRQFAVLIGAQVPIVEGLRSVGRQTRNHELQRVVVEVAAEVESGTALSTALAAHPRVFSDFFVNIIKSGETTGRLEEVMNYLADQMEKDYDLMQRIRGAMMYPLFVIIGLVVVGFVMMTFVVPKLTETLTESGVPLPWTTQALIAVSGFMQHNVVAILIGLVVAAALFRVWISRPAGKLQWDSFKLRVPVVGPLLQRVAVVRLTRSFGTLLVGGVDVPAALDICADIVGNEHYRQLLLETRREVADGNSVTSVLFRDPAMPNMVPQMLAVGEETGRMSEVLERLTGFYSRELDNSVANLVSAIEPLIMLVMGGAVGVMVAAIMLPMYQLATSF
jgi:type IV pilus assembly protein PilC